jgi:hypothetical protein
MTLNRSTSLLAVVLLAACSSDDPTEPPGNGGDEREILADPSFATHVQEIFTRKGCATSSCHGSSQQAGLLLTAGNSYAELVGVASTNEPARTRVIAGDAENSYLVVKLEGRQSVGSRMPLTGSPLDNIDLTNVRNWIDQGARNN